MSVIQRAQSSATGIATQPVRMTFKVVSTIQSVNAAAAATHSHAGSETTPSARAGTTETGAGEVDLAIGECCGRRILNYYNGPISQGFLRKSPRLKYFS